MNSALELLQENLNQKRRDIQLHKNQKEKLKDNFEKELDRVNQYLEEDLQSIKELENALDKLRGKQ